MDSKKPTCVKCRFFYITWEQPNSRACRKFGFKSPEYPSQIVLRNSGRPCQAFSPKQNTGTDSSYTK